MLLMIKKLTSQLKNCYSGLILTDFWILLYFAPWCSIWLAKDSIIAFKNTVEAPTRWQYSQSI